jgi:hypothetical protein
MCYYVYDGNILILSHNGMALIKFIANQGRTIFQYKNIRNKVLKCCANIYFNKQFLNNKIIPSYANIKLPDTSPAARKSQRKIHDMRIKDEIRSLYSQEIVAHKCVMVI